MSVQPPRQRPPAVPARFALTLLQEISATGDDPQGLLCRIGLPFTLAALRQGRVEVLSDTQFIQLYRECITVLSAHANRERSLPPMSKDEVDMLCYCVINCTNLAEVIGRAGRFCAMLDHRAADLSLEVRGDTAVFHMVTRRLRHSASGLLTDLSGLSFYHRLFSWLIGAPIPVSGYSVYSEAQADRATLERFFHQPIRLGAPDNHFAFPRRYLEKPVVRSYQRLVERLHVFPFDQLREPREDGGLAEAVEHIVAARLAQGEAVPTQEQFASYFNLSRATFQRRLREEGVGLEAIKQRVRLKLACELLQPAARLKVSDVALRLGFGDVRAFRRAFAGWTGCSPDAWRRSAAGKEPAVDSGAAPVV